MVILLNRQFAVRNIGRERDQINEKRVFTIGIRPYVYYQLAGVGFWDCKR